ncbi:zinc finger MYM-type protein 1-like [Chenopodium quinoa]|uniref:zinc finger MYM-type protein 1-like n=1 Tax=Chenopodium quinoa TaxID=63459 RepID=UPI000B783D98|nr:zinc finger MYM-type protein 1-like [Chenopodium quinoa]
MDQDAVRRVYIQRGPCQPLTHKFPQSNFGGGTLRRFNRSWFKKYTWLEYSQKMLHFALCAICLRMKLLKLQGGGDAFVVNGFRSWNRPVRFRKHIGGVNSAHNQDLQKFEDIKNPKTSIQTSLTQASDQAKHDYRVRLTASLQCLRFLLRQGLAFRGHDESEDSNNKGNFLELLQWFAEKNEDVGNVVLKNAPGNNQMTTPSIQKDLINSCAKETTKAIVNDIGDDYFGILVDESSDASQKEQMALCVRYVDKKGMIMERFLGIVHVRDTTALSLKEAILSLLNEHSLSLSRVRGQGYDGASNMKGEINGLKTLIKNETSSAYYIHCFAHQLQLTLVAVSKKRKDCGWLFDTLCDLLNVVGVSCKRKDVLRGKQAEKVTKAIENGERESGKSKNQELALARRCDTRWGSCYKLMVNVIALYPAIREVLDLIGDDARNCDDARKADNVSFAIESFDFIFMIHLMKTIFGIVNELNKALQKGDQDIVNAMSLVSLTKERLQDMRESGWDNFLTTTTTFCEKNGISVLDMNGVYTPPGRKKRGRLDTTNMHHFRIEVFFSVIDL